METVILYAVYLPFNASSPEIFSCEATKKAKAYQLSSREAAFGYKLRMSLAKADKSPDLAWLRYIMYHKKKESDLLEVADKHRQLWMQAQTQANKIIGG